MDLSKARALAAQGSPDFWKEFGALAQSADFSDLLLLAGLRRKALAKGIPAPFQPTHQTRVAVLGGCTLHPLNEMLLVLLAGSGIGCELFLGDYDNFVAEILEADGALYQFKPNFVVLLPGPQRAHYPGSLLDPPSLVEKSASSMVSQVLDLCRTAHERSRAEIILGNFIPPHHRDPGAFRSKTLASDWSFKRWINLELGLKAPPYVRICDLDFLAYRHGGVSSHDPAAWFETKQLCSSSLLAEIARELAHLIVSSRLAPKKVLALDLDNTLWGGVVADDGLDGIELGDISARGQAFKSFQAYIRSLKERGVLLAVCSKNDHSRAAEAFDRHPEMVLRQNDFVSFKANWDPKSDNLRAIASELNLGLDSFVFVDDNPAEIEIVRQFTPEVATLLLGPDPAHYVVELQDARFFEPRALTEEDAQRTSQYRAEADRRALEGQMADLGTYLESLAMEAQVQEFVPDDVPRLSQLINKSNQFNLTTLRRTEAEVSDIMGRSDYLSFSVRLKDRFGEHGLISVAIARLKEDKLDIDTWIMSCRVLKRQVEDLVLNELARLAKKKNCTSLLGHYIPSSRNSLVQSLLPDLGFERMGGSEEHQDYVLELTDFSPRPTKISVQRRAYESD